ncbi:hypothetical protein ACS0TY_001751 [Phlomoides rotata]
MGNHSTKMSEASGSNSVKKHQFSTELDVDLQSFDTSLQARTRNVINSLASGVEVRAVSLESLREITECLLEMNQEVVKVILECKKDVWKNQELFELVEEYFENSLKTLDFCTSLDKCLKRIRDQQLLIQIALQRDDEEEGNERYSKTLEELNKFKDAGGTFSDDFIKAFQSLHRHQTVMLEKLQKKKKKLDKKLKHIHAWRRVSSIIFAATLAAVLISSVVAAAVAAPPVAAVLAGATSIPLGSMGKWVDSLMAKYEKVIKRQKDMINSMSVGTYITIKDLDNIRVLIDRLEMEIKGLWKTAELGVKEEAVEIAIDEIKKKLDVFMKIVEELGVQADNVSRDTRRARTVILQRIINPPHN